MRGCLISSHFQPTPSVVPVAHSIPFLFFALLLQASQPKEWCYENFINFRSMQSADSVREQLARIMRKLSLPLLSTDFESQNYYLNLRRCMAAGLFMQVRAPVYVYVYVYASLSPLHWSTAFISLVFISFQWCLLLPCLLHIRLRIFRSKATTWPQRTTK